MARRKRRRTPIDELTIAMLVVFLLEHGGEEFCLMVIDVKEDAQSRTAKEKLGLVARNTVNRATGKLRKQQWVDPAIYEEPISIDEPLDEESEHGLYAFLEGTDPGPEEHAVDESLRTFLRKIIQTLPPKERFVLSERFGLSGSNEHTVQEVAQKLGWTQSWVRQIEVRALFKLRKMIAHEKNFMCTYAHQNA